MDNNSNKLTGEEAVAKIDQVLREEHTGYDFASLSDCRDWVGALREAEEWGDESVTIKPPSGTEVAFPIAWVRAAVGYR